MYNKSQEEAEFRNPPNTEKEEGEDSKIKQDNEEQPLRKEDENFKPTSVVV